MATPKYPDIVVNLSGNDSNAFAILGNVKRSMKKANVPSADVDAFFEQAMSGDYDELLQTCHRWVTIY